MFTKNALHYRFDNGHLGGGLTTRNQTLLQTGYRLVFPPAACAAFQVRMALKRFVAVQEALRAGDQIVPAFSAVHVQFG